LFHGGTSEGTYGYYVVAADGTGGKRFRPGGSSWELCCWAPDGQRFALASDYQSPQRDDLLTIFDTRSESLDTLLALEATHVNALAWNAVTDRILFTVDAPGPPAVISAVDPSGSTVDTVVVVPELRSSWGGLDWSRSGAQFLFVAGPASSGLYVAEVDGSGWRQLTVGMYLHGARWSPDGAQIAFSDGSETPQIHIIDADGSDSRTLTSNLFSAGGPSWVVRN
jgi:dipeptidyl aminopeptidase/acylaminoacyl peptidase